MKLVGFTLKGTMPMLMHADNIDAADMLSAWRKDSANRDRSAAGDDRSPSWTWQTYLYNDGDKVAFPSENIMAALRQAGAKKILKKQKTYKELSQSGLLIQSEFCEFTSSGNSLSIDKIEAYRNVDEFAKHAAAAEKMGFRLYVKRAKVGTSKHIRVRPRFDDWQISGEICILDESITVAVLQELFDLAGKGGLGDWRPACKTPGPYGMFSTTLAA